jgi:hypothetical protein
MNERAGNAQSRVYDRTLLLHGPRRNEMLSLAEIEQYGLDSFADADYVSIYGMPPREWYRHGIRLLGRTEVIEQIVHQFPKHNILLATQVYEKVGVPSLTEVQTKLDWTELRIYDINEKGRNHGILLGTKRWAPR